jgi:nucleoside-diphosphate-sugar epimerase
MDQVYHCAAAVGVGVVSRDEYYRVNVEGTGNVVAACEQAGVPALVHVSTQSVTFDFTERRNATEDNPGYPSRFKDPYSESKALGEMKVLAAGQEERLRTCAIRPTFIWGPHDNLMLPAVARMAKQNQLFLINGGQSEISPCHVENVCDIMMLAADKEQASGEAYLVTDDQDLTVGEFLARMTEAAGLPTPSKSIHYSIAFTLGAIVEKIHELPFVKKPPSMSRYGVAIMGRDLTFSCEKAKRDLGYRPATTIDQGMEGLSEWIKEIGGVDRLIR